MDNTKFIDSIQNEVDASYLYSRIAAGEKDEVIAGYYKQMSDIENHHLQKMLAKGKEMGINVIPKPSFRARMLDRIGKRFGYGAISNMMVDTEKSISSSVIRQKMKTGEQLQGNETRHVSILKSLKDLSGERLTRIEGRHRSVGGNALRAAVLGANDGLVSNMSLVMGVAGATNGEQGVLIAGVAGLLAGAISMALGEWISVKSSQELYEKQIKLELEEIENTPDEEMYELALLYKA
ncbi:MAG: rubrerythrin family protein, partial [Chitinophagaceae bacterium]